MIDYRAVYNLCSQHYPYNYSQDVYDKYLDIFKDYIDLWVSEFTDSKSTLLFH